MATRAKCKSKQTERCFKKPFFKRDVKIHKNKREGEFAEFVAEWNKGAGQPLDRNTERGIEGWI